GPDGALYLPHAPLRRAFSLALGLTDEPLLGGVSKWGPTRYDLLARDAACAAADRGESALATYDACPDSARADGAQMRALLGQVRDHALPGALARSQIDGSTRVGVADRATAAERALDAFLAG